MSPQLHSSFLEFFKNAALSRNDGSARALVASNPPFRRAAQAKVPASAVETAETQRQLAHTFNWLVTLGFPANVAAEIVRPGLDTERLSA